MRAAVIREHGGLEKIEILQDYPDPSPGQNEVRVRVGATSLNYHDIFSRRGMPGIKIPMPLISGSDIAGTIDKVGDGVEGWSVGDRVLVDPITHHTGKFGITGEVTPGGKAEYCVVGDYQLISLPESVSFEDAAALPIAYGTAKRMLFTKGNLAEGETVLILGASGGVGVACVQLAKMAGARIIVCASSDEKLIKLKQLGADYGVNYKELPFADGVGEIVGKPGIHGDGGVDVVVNFTGGDTWTPSIRCAKKSGRILTCGATVGYDVSTDLRFVWSFEQTIQGSSGWERRDLTELIELVEFGKLKPVIDRLYSIEESAEAERQLEERLVFGKILVQP